MTDTASAQASSRAPVDVEAPTALGGLFRETATLFFRLRVVAEEIHGQGELSAARRSFLRDLDRHGPQTVPQMARSRPVSRQNFQKLANALAEEGHVEFFDNPAHKRSRLVRLTPQGRALVDAMERREAKLLSRFPIDIPEGDMQAAAAVLRALREQFESQEWQQLLEREGA
ncbi:MAG: MarR family transcriptional regulator [Gemmatimonadota bacterium]|nr:MAG: MarR family transcriptional regulator [Gemmatimonadota bacterium]